MNASAKSASITGATYYAGEQKNSTSDKARTNARTVAKNTGKITYSRNSDAKIRHKELEKKRRDVQAIYYNELKNELDFGDKKSIKRIILFKASESINNKLPETSRIPLPSGVNKADKLSGLTHKQIERRRCNYIDNLIKHLGDVVSIYKNEKHQEVKVSKESILKRAVICLKEINNSKSTPLYRGTGGEVSSVRSSLQLAENIPHVDLDIKIKAELSDASAQTLPFETTIPNDLVLSLDNLFNSDFKSSDFELSEFELASKKPRFQPLKKPLPTDDGRVKDELLTPTPTPSNGSDSYGSTNPFDLAFAAGAAGSSDADKLLEFAQDSL